MQMLVTMIVLHSIKCLQDEEVSHCSFCHHCCCLCLQDMSSVNMYDAGVSLSGLACFITTDLARDLANDIMTLVRLGINHGLDKFLSICCSYLFSSSEFF